MTLDRDYKL